MSTNTSEIVTKMASEAVASVSKLFSSSTAFTSNHSALTLEVMKKQLILGKYSMLYKYVLPEINIMNSC